MKVWVIRGKYDRESQKEFFKQYPYYDEGFKDGQYLYWSRKSEWVNKDKVSVQVNKPSADRAFKRAKNNMSYDNPKVVDIELTEAELIMPNGE